MKPRIDKAYYRTGPGLRLWLPFNRERRLWRAGAIHVREYRHQMAIRALINMFDMEVGETRDGVTLIAKAP